MNLILLRVFVFSMVGYTSDAFHNSRTCHKNDCSQGKLFEGDDTFQCKIRNYKGWKDFQRKYNVKEKYNEDLRSSLLPPLITSVKWYTIPITVNDTQMYQPALNITFSFPGQQAFYAVLLKLSSPNNTNVTDEVFYNNPRYRLFDFQNYSSSNYYRKYHREINYGCLWGFEITDYMRVYDITLTGYSNRTATSGVSVTHRLTVYNSIHRTYSIFFDPKSWKSTIMTVVFPGTTDIYIVFEPAPVNVLSYRIELFKLESDNMFKTSKFKIIEYPFEYTYTFKNNSPGTYIVKVHAIGGGCLKACPSSESYKIILPGNNTTLAVDPILTDYVSSVIGVTVFIVLTCIVLCIWKLKGTKRVVLLAVCDNIKSRDVANAFSEYLRQDLKCSIIVCDTLQQINPSSHCCAGTIIKNLRIEANIESTLTMIMFCCCHREKISNILQHENVSLLSKNVILIKTGNESVDNFSDLINNPEVLDLREDLDKIQGYVHRRCNTTKRKSCSSPYYQKLMNTINHTETNV